MNINDFRGAIVFEDDCDLIVESGKTTCNMIVPISNTSAFREFLGIDEAYNDFCKNHPDIEFSIEIHGQYDCLNDVAGIKIFLYFENPEGEALGKDLLNSNKLLEDGSIKFNETESRWFKDVMKKHLGDGTIKQEIKNWGRNTLKKNSVEREV